MKEHQSDVRPAVGFSGLKANERHCKTRVISCRSDVGDTVHKAHRSDKGLPLAKLQFDRPLPRMPAVLSIRGTDSNSSARARRVRKRLFIRQGSRDAQVSEQYSPVVVDKEIRRFHVTVDKPVDVEIARETVRIASQQIG